MRKTVVRILPGMVAVAASLALGCVCAAAPSPTTSPSASGNCPSSDPALAISACTAIIGNPSVPNAEKANALAIRALAYSSRAYSDDAKSAEDWSTCVGTETEASLAACTRIIDNLAESNERRADALYNRSKKLSAAGLKDEAMADFKRSLKPFGDHQPNSRERAIADYSDALKLDPNKSSWLAERGQLYLSLDKFDAARADFSKALALNDKEGIALLGRAFMRDMKGDKRGAMRDLEAITALPTDSDAAKWLNQTATDLISRIGAK